MHADRPLYHTQVCYCLDGKRTDHTPTANRRDAWRSRAQGDQAPDKNGVFKAETARCAPVVVLEAHSGARLHDTRGHVGHAESCCGDRHQARYCACGSYVYLLLRCSYPNTREGARRLLSGRGLRSSVASG